jgi:hypothetical protein
LRKSKAYKKIQHHWPVTIYKIRRDPGGGLVPSEPTATPDSQALGCFFSDPHLQVFGQKKNEDGATVIRKPV